MTDQADLDYYQRREAQCKKLADSATDIGTKQVHREMAAIYAKRAAELKRVAGVRAGASAVAA